ncbi:hypothetical protein HQ305_03010 [Rhodococcus sp. BP-149]|jgi:hypothetical protein|uniref:hypothetical protein n=1 Tax=unclassified Rhodococcus (in: high G+C Gram-positive bacteria) TaxID=192944 RepID=UPI0006F690C0|nr:MULTISPECIES: hypothetical protein [unclassified Rhodococcus (in: high G+C Gram-positive bacteria)]MBY6677242.1 hypothetical protein [Rhodococcus sp. BP-332]MBY6680243.1 hypothetical protein [Rhodococcus sp. BP-316]MBY6684610.1 hypothetical protein [Rhodococcus sp. BP-288]MBY6695423.1 hypothetical protein [Rhodococcus sp. BP-188]MBY6698804.1 hypothetical protein [Rhodococcus sp. BP-285]
MSDSVNEPVDTASIDPREESKGTGADTAQSPDERDEAVREFDNHAEAEPAPTLDRSEAAVDEGKDLPAPSPRDVTAGDKDDKQTARQE